MPIMKKRITVKNLNLWTILCLIFFLSASTGLAADATLTWNSPTQNEDGSPLEDLGGYILYFGTSSGTYTQSIDVNNVTTYQLTGLSDGTTYYFAITAYDTSGNESTYSNELAMTTPAPADTTAPVISNIQSSAISESSVTVSWATDEAADTQIQYGTTTSYGTSTALNSSLTTSHSQGLDSLAASTLYHYRVLSRDEAGNLASSADYTFTTSEATQFDYYCDSDSDGFIAGSVSGTCTGADCVPAECTTTAGNDCDDSNPDIHPDASDDNCNGVDDNCSGTPDSNYVITVTSCGTGVCSSVGQLECSNGVESNTCTPGTPAENEEATCDELDNDCDGLIDEGCSPVIKISPVIISEDFSGGIPDTWSTQGSWGTDNNCQQNIEYPFEESAAIVDSSCSATNNDVLITDSFDTLSCSSLDLTFTNQYYWYSGSMEIDVSDNGGATWTNNLYIDADAGYPTPQWRDVDISSITNSTEAQVRFKYLNTASSGFWAIDNVWVTCQSSQVTFESTVLTSAVRTIMITNSGNEDITVGEPSVSGVDALDFSLTENNGCSNQTLSPAETCTFDIEFFSPSLGTRSADISIPSNDPSHPVSTLSLAGTVVNHPVPQIMINGSSGHVSVSGIETVSLTIELDPGDLGGKKADWWVQYEYSNRTYYYDVSSGKWRRGSHVYNQAELSDTGTITIEFDSRSPRGLYTYYFGVDTKMNGILDPDVYFEDTITVEVN